jgi:hypothetical protein
MRLLRWLLFAAVPLASLAASPAPPRLYRDKVEPQWFATNTLFWYRNHLPAETREFILVDTRSGSRQPAFDHTRAAAQLSTVLKRDIAPDRLPIDRLDFSEDFAEVRLSGPDGGWRLNLATYTLTAVEPSDAGSLPAESEERPSRTTGPETSIEFDNRTGAGIQLFWIDPEGNRQPYGSLKPGKTRRQHTFAGHVWAAFHETRLLAVFEATRDSGRAIVDERPIANRRPTPRHIPFRIAEGRSVARPDPDRLRSQPRPLDSRREVRRRNPLTFDANPGHSFRKDTQSARLVGMDYDTPEAPESLPEAYWSPDSQTPGRPPNPDRFQNAAFNWSNRRRPINSNPSPPRTRTSRPATNCQFKAQDSLT